MSYAKCSSRHFTQRTCRFLSVIRIYLIIFLINHNHILVNGVQLLPPEISIVNNNMKQYLRDLLSNRIQLDEKAVWKPLQEPWRTRDDWNETSLSRMETLNDYLIPKMIDVAITNSKWKNRYGVMNADILEQLYRLLNLKKNTFNSVNSNNSVWNDNQAQSWDGDIIRSTWLKRLPNWNNLKGMWGKRLSKDWQKLQGGWGKRSQREIN